MRDSEKTALSAVAYTFILCALAGTMQSFIAADDDGAPRFQASVARGALDRAWNVEKLNNYSRYSGWDMRFAALGAEGEELLVSGAPTCSDVLAILPQGARELISSSRFAVIRCEPLAQGLGAFVSGDFSRSSRRSIPE